ncbi:MAG: hypothetical protein WCW53_02120 [Syntrophales bacterium]|jgi:hypothetical protein|nr:hypothetical protein [Syntrophales bacterium]
MEWKESEMIKKGEPGERILCIGKIHKGKKTMIIAFPEKGGNEYVAVSQSREEEGKA